MQQGIKDTAGLGTVFWLIGYLASLALFFSSFAASMGWILLVICTPVTLAITWWWSVKGILSFPIMQGLEWHGPRTQ